MKAQKQNEHSRRFLQAAGIRPTRQRMALADLLFDGCDKHMTAEQIHDTLVKSRARVALATVYNTLHQFTAAGLLHQVVIDSNQIYFDTNTGSHHHFFDQSTGELHDIPADHIHIAKLPKAPKGRTIADVEVIIRLRPTAKNAAAN